MTHNSTDFIIPLNDKLRLKKLYEYQVLDTHSEDTFDKIAILASQIFNTGSAFITFVDEDRVFFKANISNIKSNVVNRNHSLCSLAILKESQTVFYDTHDFPSLMDNPFVIDPNGIRFYAAAPLKTPEGFLLGTLCVTDSTPRETNSVTPIQLEMLKSLSEVIINKLESRLRYKNLLTAQADLMNIALHEIKNPLASINLANDIMKKDVASVGRMSEMIKQCVTRIQTKLGDLLKQSELEEAQLLLSIEETDLKDMLNGIIRNFELQANKKNQVIELEFDSQLSTIYVDKIKISDIFHNLLSNALKYSYPNSIIKIITRALDNNTVEIEFRDQGQGLSELDIDKLFLKFARLSSRPTGKETSNGLGLSICKSLVELHHGKIYAKSLGKEKGTSFFVKLPIKFEKEKEQAVAQQ